MKASDTLEMLLMPIAATAALLETGVVYMQAEAKGHEKLVKIECFEGIQKTLPDDKKQDDTAIQARNSLIDNMF